MFLADGIAFLELQKTGGSHICQLLEQYANGKAAGKHNRVTKDLDDRYVIGSMRNPWDWYVSLWAYGVGGKGAIRARTAKRLNLDYYYRMLPKSMGKNWLTPREFLLAAGHDLFKPVVKWQHSYRDSEDAEAFRQWLKLLLSRQHRFDIGEGYGFSPLSRHAGLLSYRYFRLFTQGDSIYRDARLLTDSGLADFDRELNISDGFIRTESLEDDFIRVLTEAGIALDESQLASIRTSKKTNVSRRRPVTYYYDEETIELVADRERYLIGKYDYTMPT